MKIRKGDKIKVLAGKSKGKESVIESVVTNTSKVVVTGVNEVKRHVKGNANQKSEIVVKLKPIDVSNVILICPKCNKPTRVGIKIVDNKKHRICKKCQEVI